MWLYDRGCLWGCIGAAYAFILCVNLCVLLGGLLSSYHCSHVPGVILLSLFFT